MELNWNVAQLAVVCLLLQIFGFGCAWVLPRFSLLCLFSCHRAQLGCVVLTALVSSLVAFSMCSAGVMAETVTLWCLNRIASDILCAVVVFITTV
eukprot:2777113-Ditylum_brightwellii.AAC.1